MQVQHKCAVGLIYVPQLNLDVFLPLIVLLSYTTAASASASAAPAAPTADKEDQYLQLLSGVATH